MSTFAERCRNEGRAQGMQQGRQRGETSVLLRPLPRKFGPVPEGICESIETANEASLLEWPERVPTANRLGEIFR